MKRLFCTGLFFGASLFLIADCVLAQNSDENQPTLIIAGPGIHSDGQMLFKHVRQMFGITGEEYRTTAVTFRGQKAHVYTGQVQDDPVIGAQVDNQNALRDSAKHVGRYAARSQHSVLQLDMDLLGLDVAAGKGFAGEYERLSPTLAARRMSLKLVGQKNPGREIRDWLEKRRTTWNQETERAAVFIEQAAREFKKKYPEGKVVVFGHSAFTNAINLVKPDQTVKVGNKETRLIDFRVMSSPMVRTFKYPDPDHTLVVSHQYDLPASNMGNIHSAESQTSHGDWSKEARMVLHLKSPTTNPFYAHFETQYYTQLFEMEIKTADGSYPFRGKPSDIIKRMVEGAFDSSSRFEEKFIESLQRQKPRESRVGGITLTKPANVPLDPSDIRKLDYRNGGYVFQLWDGTIELPGQTHPEISATAITCIYDTKTDDQPGDDQRGQPPELTMMPYMDEDGELWTIIGYIPNVVSLTRLGDLMLEADSVLAEIAIGETQGYEPPHGIPDYHPYTELTLDNQQIRDGRITGRVWIVPGIIDTSVVDGSLRIDNCTMAVRFESYPVEKEEEYYVKNADVAVREPAGEFLGAQLTAHFETLVQQYPVLEELKQAAAFVGVVIWARQNGIELSEHARQQIVDDYKQDFYRRAYGEPQRTLIKKIKGQEYEVVPMGELREIKAEDLSRPAVIFNEYGISRLLWKDQTESRINYDSQGRVANLVSRNGEVSRLLYDEDGKLVAIVDPHGEGVPIIWSDDISLACFWADVDSETLECTLREDANLVPIADVPGFAQQWIRDWTAVESEREGAAALRDVVKNSGTTLSWVRWSHNETQLWIAAAAALLLVLASAVCLECFDNREPGVFEDLLRPVHWLVLLPCAGVALLLIVMLEGVPAVFAFFQRTEQWDVRRIIELTAFLIPLILPACLLQRQDKPFGGLRFAAAIAGLIGLIAVHRSKPEWLEAVAHLFFPCLIVLACCMAFNIYHTVFQASRRRVPNLSVFYLFLVVACAIYVWPSQEAIGSWTVDGAAMPSAAKVEHFSRTSLVSLAQLRGSSSESTLAQLRSGVFLPAAALAFLAVTIDWLIPKRSRFDWT